MNEDSEDEEECDDVPDENEGIERIRKPSMLDGLRDLAEDSEGSFGSPLGGSP